MTIYDDENDRSYVRCSCGRTFESGCGCPNGCDDAPEDDATTEADAEDDGDGVGIAAQPAAAETARRLAAGMGDSV